MTTLLPTLPYTGYDTFMIYFASVIRLQHFRKKLGWIVIYCTSFMLHGQTFISNIVYIHMSVVIPRVRLIAEIMGTVVFISEAMFDCADITHYRK